MQWQNQTPVLTYPSHTIMMFGRTSYFKLASGLNLFAILREGLHTMSLERVNFTNNRARLGNLYMAVVVDSPSDILILLMWTYWLNIFRLCLSHPSHFLSNHLRSLPPSYNCLHSLYSFYNYIHNHAKKYRKIKIIVQNSNFIGSCVTIQESMIRREGGKLNFEMNNITINESSPRNN